MQKKYLNEYICAYAEDTMDPTLKEVFEDYLRSNTGIGKYAVAARQGRRYLQRLSREVVPYPGRNQIEPGDPKQSEGDYDEIHKFEAKTVDSSASEKKTTDTVRQLMPERSLSAKRKLRSEGYGNADSPGFRGLAFLMSCFTAALATVHLIRSSDL